MSGSFDEFCRLKSVKNGRFWIDGLEKRRFCISPLPSPLLKGEGTSIIKSTLDLKL